MTGDAFKLETFSDRVRSLVHGLWALYDGPSVLSGVGLHESPQSTLGLGAGEAILLPPRADFAELLVDKPPVVASPLFVVGPPLDVEMSASRRALHNDERVERAKLAPAVQKIFPVCFPSGSVRRLPEKTKGLSEQAFRRIGETGYEPATARPGTGRSPGANRRS